MEKRIKLRELTENEYKNWLKENCKSKKCKNCPFYKVECITLDTCWIKNKDLYSDKFLNQEIKIEVPELLTTKEKDYLKGVIRPFKNKVISISKRSFNIELEYISILIKEDFRVNFPNFVINNYYKNMEVCKEYTLKELGLFEENKYKITLTEFWNSKDRLAIHCDTEEKANKLLKVFDKLGKKWASNDSYLRQNFYKYYKEKTYYTNDNLYGNCKCPLVKKYKIYEFDEVDLEN